jgi:excisionase family DNA binding protein
MGKKRASKRHSAGSPAPAASAPDTSLLTMDETIGLLKTTRPTFYRWLRSGKLRGTRVGRQWRFAREEVDRFLKGHEPAVELPVDIAPLMEQLQAKLESVTGVRERAEASGSAVAQAAEQMIQLAAALRASDLHLDAQEGGAKLRLRVDGVLQLIATFDLRLLPAIVERWKTLASMDVREKAMPQDGRIVRSEMGLDLRVCVVPAYLGESLTARILSAKDVKLELDHIPLAAADRKRLDRALASPWGMIVVTGATGSGKTTTLLSCLRKLADEDVKVVSIEDPVEYLLPGVTQMRVNHRNGLTFESLQRAAFRTDPDVVMVGEVRNAESLKLCLMAALTGRMVLTTLHVDEAAGALRRMLDLGVEPFVIADGSRLVLAQQLVRRLCEACSVADEPGAEQLEEARRLCQTGGVALESLPRKYRRPVGCQACGQLGFRGRTIMAEALEMSPEVAAGLRANAPLKELRRIAVSQGMTTIATDGIRRAAEGEVFLPEVLSAASGIPY